MVTSQDVFRPVKGTESNILSKPVNNGYVYFATDTGHIYVDDKNDRILVGGGQGATIYYAYATAVEENEQKYYVINKTDLENPDITYSLGDIIINSDGSFYKISYFPEESDQEIWCDRIAVSGSGGDGGSSLTKKINVKINAPETTNLINGQEFSISLVATSAIDSEGVVQDEKLQVTWSLSEKSSSGTYNLYYEKTIDVFSGEQVEIEIGSMMRENSTIKLMVSAYGINSGQSAVRSIDFTTSNLSLEPSENFSTLNLFDTSNVTIQCNVRGNTEKLLYYYWDGVVLDGMPIALSADATTFQTQSISSALATHGRHTVKIELYQNVNGKNGLKAGELNYEIAVKGASSDPIIWLSDYKDNYYDYENIQILFQVYDPTKSTAIVNLYKGNKEVLGSPREVTRDAINPKFEIWEITDADVGLKNSYSIVCGEEGRQDRYDITFEVEETDKLKLAFPEAMVLKFDATGRSNSESATNRSQWVNSIEGYEKYDGNFTNFNWYNNGWVSDDDNQTCLRISNGANFNIDFEPMVFSSGVEGKNSWTIEMQFKVSNLRNYDNLITTYSRYSGDDSYWEAFNSQKNSLNGYTNYDAFLRNLLGGDADKLEFSHVEKVINTDAAICQFYDGTRGFCLGSQDGFFTTGANTVNVNYVEDEMVHLAIVFSHSNQFISIYLNGILTGIEKSTVKSFTINSNQIQFNSDYCDINLYKMRVYNTNLAINYIDLNVATDKKDIDIYDQTNLAKYNSSLNEYQFDYDAMIEYNKNHPDNEIMPYVIWTTTSKQDLPYSKSNIVNASMEFHNVALDRAYANGTLYDYALKDGLTDEECLEKYGMSAVQYYYMHHCPSWHGDNVEMKVQGTSSEFYPRRNYKVKTKVADDEQSSKYVHMYMNEGPFADEEQQLKWFYYDNYTVGTTKFTMKIDFMESSGTYNVGFANLVNNAYTKHPLDDYIAAGAFQKIDSDSTTTEETNEYDENTLYYYYNHKGNIKPADGEEDNLVITSQEDFDKGPYALYGELMTQNPDLYTKKKVASEEDYPNLYNKWYKRTVGYKTATIENTQDYRTSVQGFPVLAFHKHSDTGEIKYVGRYNMILDKGSDEAYGFALDDVYQKFADNKEVSSVAECWEFSDNIGTFCSFREPTFDKGTLATGGGPIVVDSFEYRYHDEADDLDLIYNLNSATEEDLAGLSARHNLIGLTTTNKQPAIDWTLDIMKHWEKACSWVYSTCTDVVPSQEEIDANDWDAIQTKYNLSQDDITFEEAKDFGDSIKYLYDTKEYRLAKFRKELSEHFDIDYVATYFVMTEVFECYDSRGKNCMMASWGPLKEGGDYIWYPIFYDIDTQLGINNTGIPSFTFDIDATQDGSFSTNDSVLWNNFFTCFKDSYVRQKYRQLRGWTSDVGNFSKLNKPPIATIDNIENWYLSDYEICGRGISRTAETRPFLAMKGQKPLIALNLDEYYKYITITNSNISAGGGYIGQNGSWISDNTNGEPSGTYFYALQGDRSLSRQQFLTNRINYIDSWLYCGAFQRGESSDVIWGRISANNPSEFPDFWVTETSDTVDDFNLTVDAEYWNEDGTKKHEFDAEYWINLKFTKPVYTAIGLDNTALTTLSQKYSGETVKIELPEDIKKAVQTRPQYDEQLLYIYGSSQISDLGDMSKLYWSEFHLPNSCDKLTRLMLGNDNFDTNSTGYYRYGTQVLTMANMPLLQEVCLSGVKTSNNGITYNISSSEKLQSFRALRTDITGMTFAKGVALHTLYLPSGITSLELIEARQLTNLLTEYPVTHGENVGEYNCEKGLYIERLFDADSPYTAINTITLEGDSFGYDSYKLLKQIVDVYNGSSLKVSIKGVNWCPYKLLDEGSVYNSEEADLYFVSDNHYGFSPYVYDASTWELDILNGEVYKLNEEELNNNGTLITDTLLFDTEFVKDKYGSSTEGTSKYPTLEGIIYINNTTEIDEGYIRNNLQVMYPNLQFAFANVKQGYSAEFKMVEDDGTYTIIDTQKISADDIDTTWFKNPSNEYSPTKLDYDFLGWSISNSEDDILGDYDEAKGQYIIKDSDWLALKDTNEHDYVFYAIFTIHNYQVIFYDGDNTTILDTQAIPYGTVGITAPNVIPWKNDAALSLTMTYGFKGYTNNLSTNKIVDLSKQVIRNDSVYYPVFEEISVYDNNHPEYFNITSNGWVSWNTNYTYRGKLTIPLIINSIPVQGVNEKGFSLQGYSKGQLDEVTHIFWSGTPDSRFTRLGRNSVSSTSYCFQGLAKLQYFEMPSTITRIEDYCFNSCSQLFKGDYSNSESPNYYVDTFFKNIEYIGTLAFTSTGLKDIILGSKLTTLKKGAFKSIGNGSTAYSCTLNSKILDYDSCGEELFADNNLLILYCPSDYKTDEWSTKFACNNISYI